MATAFKLETTTEFPIRRDIPIPPVTGGGRRFRYPFAAMRAGDSFEVSMSDYSFRGRGRSVNTVQNTLSNCARSFAARHNPRAKFTTRKVDDRTIRVWRVK